MEHSSSSQGTLILYQNGILAKRLREIGTHQTITVVIQLGFAFAVANSSLQGTLILSKGTQRKYSLWNTHIQRNSH